MLCPGFYDTLFFLNYFFVSSSCPGSDSFPDRRPPRKGNTLYVYGVGMSDESLRAAFSVCGNIIDLSMDPQRKWDTAHYSLCVCVRLSLSSCVCLVRVWLSLCVFLFDSAFGLSQYLISVFIFLAVLSSPLRRWSQLTRPSQRWGSLNSILNLTPASSTITTTAVWNYV